MTGRTSPAEVRHVRRVRPVITARRRAQVAFATLIAILMTVGLQVPAQSATTYSIVYSTSSNRANPMPLAGAAVHDNIYAFTTPDTNVSQVRFFVDDPNRAGAPVTTERAAPFDLMGGNRDGTAKPYDTKKLTNADHTLTAEITLKSGVVDVVTVTFTVNQASARVVANPNSVKLKAAEAGMPTKTTSTVSAADGAAIPVAAASNATWLTVTPDAGTTPMTVTITADPTGLAAGSYTGKVSLTSSNPDYASAEIAVAFSVVTVGTYDVSYSTSATRANPATLEGATVSGSVYAFTTPDTDVSKVRFFVDDTTRSGTPYQTENAKPFDLGGTAKDGSALPYDTTKLADGEHSITAELTLTSGVVTVTTEPFTVANTVPSLTLSSSTLSLTSDGSVPVNGKVGLDAANTAPASFSAVSDVPWLTVSPTTGVTPAELTVTADPAGLPEGKYTGTITASAPDVRSVALTVVLTIAYPASALVFTPTSLSLSSDGSGPVTEGVSLAAQRPADATFSLTSDQPWLSVSPASGSTPASLSVVADPAGLAVGTYTGTITATADDGRTASLPTTFTVRSNECTPVPCEDILVGLPYHLDFSENSGGLKDAAGVGSGFTYVDQPTKGTGYIPSKLSLDLLGSKLAVGTTAGLAAASSNSQDNAVGVGIDAPSQISVIRSTLLSPPAGTGNFEQAGTWFGNDEDNYDKIVVLSTSTGTVIEHLTEVGGTTSKRTRSAVMSLSSARVVLSLRADPGAKTVTAYYSVDGAPQQKLGAHSVPGEFFSFDAAGIDPRIGTRSFGGIFTSHRNSATPLTYVFDDFTVEQAPASSDGGSDGGSAGSTSTLAFDRVSSAVNYPTSMALGPDGRLYVTELFGKIHALTLGADKKVVNDQVIGTLGTRLTLGIAVDPASTASDIVLWVSHSSPSTDNGEVNSSTVTRLSGTDFADRQDVITGLPRAKANHAINSIHFGPDGKLYIAMGGNTGAGAPNLANTEFGDRPEQPLSAALLVADVKAAGFEGQCATPLYSFGVPTTCDVRTFSTGLRNMYDFTFHSNGQIYGSDNGLGVTGTYPPRPEPDCTGLADASLHNPGSQPDSLQRLTDGAYYGHPNPYRNECVFSDGSKQGVAPPANYVPRMHNLGNNKSANGTVEYLGDAFCGALQGDLLIANYSQGDDITRIRLAADGKSVVSSEQLIGGFKDPLPLVVGPDGTVYVGEFGAKQVTALVPKDQGCWTTQTPMPVQLLDVGGAALNGKVYVVGGKNGSGYNATAMHVYDPLTDTWTTAPALPRAVENPAVVAYGGRLYVFGGSPDPFSRAVPDASVYDPAVGAWSALPAMSIGRSGAVAQVLGDKIYVAGGMGPDGASLASAEAFDVTSSAWSAAPAMSTRRDNAGAAVLDGRMYVFGGRTRNADGSTVNGTLNTVESYDPSTGAWTAKASMPTGRRTMVVAAIGGRAQVMGGEVASDGSSFKQNEEYDAATDSWRQLTPMTTGRHGAAVGVLNGTAYVVAGGPRGGATYSSVNEAFAFGPR